jgi:transposase-like protein
MSNQKSVKEAPAETLLTLKERATCQKIARRKSLYGQRAKALLALDKGATQAEAGQQVGLTRSQVKYWLSKFRADRLQAFPEEVLPAVKTPPKPPQVETPVEEATTTEEEEQVEQPEEETKRVKTSTDEKKKKAKQSKKKKGKDKKKNGKKKKGKKGKKSKKKKKK